MTQQKRAVLYARVSSQGQTGLKSQTTRLKEHCTKNGYTVARVFEDTYTGGGDFMGRPAMRRLLEYLDEVATDQHEYVVVFDDLKRFARDVIFHWTLRAELKERGAEVECLNFTFEGTPEGEFIETVIAAQGELERKQNARQTSQKMTARLQDGYWTFQAPVGLRFKKTTDRGRVLVHDGQTAAVITEALEGFASGRFQEQEEMRRLLNQSGFFGRVYSSLVHRILTQILYAGYLEYPKWGVSRRKAKHPGLITLATFEQIQERLLDKAPIRRRLDYRPDFPLRGFVRCMRCQVPLTASWSTGHRGDRFPYYRCRGKECEVQGKSIPRQTIEARFEDILKERETKQVIIDAAHRFAYDQWERRLQGEYTTQERWAQECTRLDEKIVQLAERAAQAKSDAVATAYEAQIEKLSRERAAAAARVDGDEAPRADFGTALKYVLGFIKSPYAAWQNEELSDRRTVLKIAFRDTIDYDLERGFGTPKLSPGLALLQRSQHGDFHRVTAAVESWNDGRRCRNGPRRDIVVDTWAEFERWILESYELLSHHPKVA